MKGSEGTVAGGRSSGWRGTAGEEPEDMRVCMLGGFSVSVGSRTVGEDGWRLKKAASLVKLLALAPGRRMHREQVQDRLWPDLDARAAANNLRQALHVARRTLEPVPETASRYLQTQGEQLALYPGGSLRVDVETFEEAATAARRSGEPTAYETALNLYAGDLLPGDPYEGWVEDRREGLRKTHLSLLVELAGLYEELREFGPAVEALRRAVTEEPTHEETQASLIRLYALSGRRAEALGQYGRLRDLLAELCGEEPSALSRHLYEEISAGRLPPSGSGQEETRGADRPAVRHNVRHNLPVARSSFVGRKREAVEIKRELAMTRLLTLTGAGGSGKTRLSLKVAEDLAGVYPDGSWLVELAPLSQGELVPQAVASALKVREQPGRTLTETLVAHLRERNLLLVLDNCEHVVDVAARLTDDLLAGCPDLKVLATSREALRAPGEVVWQVPSLSVPEPERESTVEELAPLEAVQLFVERARSRRTDFELAERNAGAVAEVCRRLDGIPLAIELAATKVGVLSVEQISQKLDDSLGLLRGGGRTALPRHQTLKGALEWSHQLLSEPEKKLFGRLSVFAGGWTLEAAEAVGAGEEVGSEGALELLELLAEKSLVVTGTGIEDEPRYRLLEPVRQYAREKLEEDGESKETHHRHALWCLELAEEAEGELTGPGYQEWLERLETEHDNLRAALGWSLNGGKKADLGLRLAAALWLFWYTHGHLAEGRGWLEKALAETA